MYNKKVKLQWNFLLLIYILFSLFGLSAAEPPQYDNLALGIPGKCDTLIDRPGYALGYIEYHEQAAFVIYKLTAREALTKEAQLCGSLWREQQQNEFAVNLCRIAWLRGALHRFRLRVTTP